MSKKKNVEEKDGFVPRGYDDKFEMEEAELERLASQIKADLLEAEEDKSDWLQERVKDINAYFGIKKQDDWPFKGAAKVSSRVHQIMVDTTAGNLVSSAIAPEDVIAVDYSKSQSAENAKYVQDLHNAIAKREYNFPELVDRGWHNALIESYRVFKPVYQYNVLETSFTVTRWLPKSYNPENIKYDSTTDTVIDAQGNVIPSLDINTVPEDPEELKALDLHECVIEVTREKSDEGIRVLSLSGVDVFIPKESPGETPADKYQRAPYVIQQEYKTFQEMQILQQQKKISNFEVVADRRAANLLQQQLEDIKQRQAGNLDTSNNERHLTRNLWWYGKFEYKGKLRELIVYMNYETGTILKVQVNQLGIRPFFPQIPLPIEDTTGGESLPKRLRSLVSELELILNTLINMGLIKAYPPKFYDPNAGFDPKTLGAVGPNSYIPVRDPSRNVFLPPQPEDPRILMEMAKFLMDLIERSAANSDAVQGQVSPTANTTAFEVQQALVRAGVRFDIIYRRLKAQLKPMFKYINMLLLRHMPLEKEVQLMGPQAIVEDEAGNQTSRLQMIYMMEGEYGLNLKGNSVMEEQTKIQKAEKLYMMLAQDQYLSYKPESPYALRFNLVQHYNPAMMDQILPKPEEVQKLVRDRQQVQLEQENAAVEQGKEQADAQAMMAQHQMQLQEQQAQLEAAKKQQDAQLDAERQLQDMRFKQAEHEQKMKQMEEAHKLKLELMKEEQRAKAKTASKPN